MRRYILFVILLLTGGFVYASGVHDDTDTLKASVVRGERSAKSIVRDASREFSRNQTDYYASFLIVRTISAGGKFREVQSAVGVFASLDFNQKTNTRLYWEDPNAMGRLYVCDTFVSENLFADKNEVNPVLNVLSKDHVDDIDAFKVNYVNSFDVSALDRKRAVEIFSPLNPKMTSAYSYKNSGTDVVNGRKVRVIDFVSNARTVSSKNRIHCSGQLFIDYNGRVQKIVVKDMDDRFTRYVRNFSEKTLVTPYTYTITYGEKDGWIYTKSVRQDLFWRKPETAAGSFYSTEWNPCRNPFKSRIKTSFVMTFSEPQMVRTDKKGSAVSANTILCYNESRDFDFWKRVLSSNVDLDKFMKDTGTTWDTLCAQTVTRQERELVMVCGGEAKVAEEKNRLAARTERARNVYKTIFKKDYTDGFIL